MELTFDRNPQTKQRPRFGKKGQVYDSQKEVTSEYRLDATTQMPLESSERPLESPIFAKMTFHMPMPKSWSQKRRKEQLGKPMTSKPDVDNLIKFIFDVLNGIAYKDDRFITSGYFEKVWAEKGKTKISITEQKLGITEENKMMNDTAVKMHLALCRIFDFSLEIKKMHSSPKFQEFAGFLEKECLDAGLDEIYREKI